MAFGFGVMAAGIQGYRRDGAVAKPILISVSKRIGSGGERAGDRILYILDENQGAIEHTVDAVVGKMNASALIAVGELGVVGCRGRGKPVLSCGSASGGHRGIRVGLCFADSNIEMDDLRLSRINGYALVEGQVDIGRD